MNIQKILWPTDLSGNAEKAVSFVDSIAEKYEAEVYVLYVIQDTAIHEPWYGTYDADHIREIQKWEQKKALERIDKVCERDLNGCRLYHKEIALGDPSEEILAFAENENVDLIVMATRGRKSRFSFGTVADRVLKNSSVPVMLVPVSASREV